MIISYDHPCFWCLAPTFICVEPYDDVEEILYDQYIDFVHEPDWHYNDHFFKRIGKKFERVCRDCFNNTKLRVSPRDLLNRQTGVSRMVRPKSRAMTVDELSVFARTLQTYFKHRQYDIRLGE
jgi:hypothetical protein